MWLKAVWRLYIGKKARNVMHMGTNRAQASPHLIIGLILLVAGALGLGCGGGQIKEIPLQNTVCQAGTAQIAVGDVYLQNLCGCQQATSIVNPPGTLTCTIPAGTTVFIHYLGTRLAHQILPTVPNSFPPSPLSDPNASTPIRSHAFQLRTAGNYNFQDVFYPALNGTFVVF